MIQERIEFCRAAAAHRLWCTLPSPRPPLPPPQLPSRISDLLHRNALGPLLPLLCPIAAAAIKLLKLGKIRTAGRALALVSIILENSLHMPYSIEYSPDSEDHLRVLTARQQRTILDSVDKQLSDQPTLETRNRKHMRPNPLAGWELRIGNLRVYYDVAEEPKQLVSINAVGIKDGNTVCIGGEVIDL